MRPASILMTALLLLLTVCSAFAGNIDGRLAYRKGDYARALREFGSPLQAGPIGSYFLALMHLRGEGVPKDERRGLELLRSSADEGYSAAQYLMGFRYYYGIGLPADKGQAMSYILAASADDDYRAVVFLKLIAKGKQNENRARERVVAEVKRQARAKVAAAQYTLAFMYLIADGVPKDGVEEVRWYRASSGRNARAAFMLSLMYQSGEGVPHDPAEAFRLMKRAAELGDSRAQYFLGTYFYQGVGTRVDRPAAAAWFRKSAEGGFSDAQLAYGMVLLSGEGVAVDKGGAVEWLAKASGQGNGRAREVLRELLTYRGQPSISAMTDTVSSPLQGKPQNESQLRLEGKGVILDQGAFGLKFSLPTLYDVYAPQNQVTAHPLWEKLQGGTFDLIIRQPQ